MTTAETIYGPPTDWVVAELERLPPVPLRRAVVLVGAERQAYALRRAVCVERGRPELLAGVLVCRPVDLARELLVRAGRVRVPGWEAIRRLRLLQLFDSTALHDRLRYFSADQLRAGQGYVDAFARTIGDLEASGLDGPTTAAIAGDWTAGDPLAAARLHDVAVVWAHADAGRDAGPYASAAQILGDGAATVAAQPALAAAFGPVCAVLTASPSTVLLRFLQALPACRVVLQDARPVRTDAHRWRRLLLRPDVPAPTATPRQFSLFEPNTAPGAGRAPAAALPDPETPSGPPGSELHLLQRLLFALPETLTAVDRTRSAGPDGTVDLEEYPSVEAEVEATATWVAEQLAAGIPAAEIALVVPEIDPYATLLADRMRRLGGANGGVSCYVDGGLPLLQSPGGVRLRTLLAALARRLEADATIRLLPALRRADQGNAELARPLSPSRAANMVYGAGIVGGSAADPSGLHEWVPRLSRRRDTLRRLVDDAGAAVARADEPDKRSHTIDRQQAQRRLKEIEAVLPAVSALQHVAAAVADGASLRAVWEHVAAFARTWLRVPPDPPALLSLIDERVQPLLADEAAAQTGGLAAVHFLIEQLSRERCPAGRFGEPRIFIGTPAQAAGLSFAAVRLLGLAEGAVPATPHDDPILPDDMRRALERRARRADHDVVVARLADQVLEDVHAAFRVVSGTRRRLALSVPRQWVDRSEREVSGIVLEVATALGRMPHAATGESTAPRLSDGDVPTAARLRQLYLDPGRACRQRGASAWPVSPRAELTHLPQPQGEALAVPPEWLRCPARGLDRILSVWRARLAPELSAADGIVAEVWSGVTPPGVRPERPLSASALGLLLACPHRFLLERILHLGEPASRPPTDSIEPVAYGALFHAAAERFFREAGAQVCAHDGDVAVHTARAHALAAEQFEQLRDEYPLRGSDAIERERRRLLRQIEHLVHDEWQRPARAYVDSERSFGDPVPVRLAVDDGALFVRGAIDRLDRLSSGGVSVRDLKTGRVRDFREEPLNAARDLQIGLYTLALEAPEGDAPGTPVVEAAYVHPSLTQEPDRAFRGPDLDLLRRETGRWLGVAQRLLSVGAFPRTPHAEDCRFCPFLPACGDQAQAQSAAKLRRATAREEIGSFVRFKEESRHDDG